MVGKRTIVLKVTRVLVPLVLLWVAACTTTKTPPPPTPSPAVLAEQATSKPVFVGDDACQPCHATEFTSHQKTRHKRSLYDATKTALGALAPPEGETASGFAILSRDDQFTALIRLPRQTERSEVPLDLAIGSGKTGLSYMILGRDRSAVLAQSYFPADKKWHITPGQEKTATKQPGGIYTAEQTKACLRCHVVTSGLEPLKPERRFYGVGCESCHGAGSQHVARMQQSPPPKDTGMRSLIGLGGKELNELCGRCHQTTDMTEKMDAAHQKSTNRFQPYGLSLSKCFLKSNNKLTCTTCHNPHEDAVVDAKHYDAVCVECHSGVTKEKRACPVNPKEKCVACHMPSRATFPGTTIPTSMADHFIRIYKKMPK